MPKRDDPTLHDVRVIKYHLRRGMLSHEQLKAHLDALPDDAEHGEPTTTRFVSTSEGKPGSEPTED